MTAVERATEVQREEEKKSRQLETELAAHQEKLTHYEDQILKVKTNEQLWALQKEVDFTKNKISESETQIIESMESLDAAAQRLVEAKKERKRLSIENKQRIAELQNNLEKMQEQHVEMLKSQEQIKQEIPKEYFALFNRIQAAKGGVGVAVAADGSCQACYFRIRPQVYLDIKHSKGIYQCDNCGRILVHEEEPPMENPAQLA
ncbi:MAG TPA: C4-type zinc ribbon domain-containing protein [Acidobacteriota bacterium]|nr:C4-type zinc ribbon domain-containing protein [Acidobacteriota bacterium]